MCEDRTENDESLLLKTCVKYQAKYHNDSILGTHKSLCAIVHIQIECTKDVSFGALIACLYTECVYLTMGYY